jgi:hypothetical protein
MKIDSRQWDWSDEICQELFWEEIENEFGSLSGDWICFAENIGWRNRSGCKTFHSETPIGFVSKAIGLNTSDYDFTLEKNKFGTYVMKVYHHDSPTGESREIYRQEDWIEQELKEYTRNELLLAFISYVRTYADDVSWTAKRDSDWITGKHDLRKLTKDDLIGIWTEFALEKDLPADTISKSVDYYLTKERRCRNGEID